MDVRAGLNDYFARLTPEQRAAHGGLNPTPDTLQKIFKAQRDAKKKAYAADEPARNARAEARAAEERARAEARAKARAAENKALAEARADTTGQALADACVEIKFRTPHAHWLISTQVALSGAGGRVGDIARRAVVARATDADLQAKGAAGKKKAKRRQYDREYSGDYRKQKKAKVEGLVQEEAQLMKRAAGFLVDLGRGGSTVLDDDGAGAFPEDEKKIMALVAAKEREQDSRKKDNLGKKLLRARRSLAAKVLQRRVDLLEIRVAELEEELLRARAAA